MYVYCFTSFSVHWGNIATEGCLTMLTLISKSERPLGFFIVHSTINSTVHPMPLNSLEHCMHNHDGKYPFRSDSNLVHPGYKPQWIRMSHRGRPRNSIYWANNSIYWKTNISWNQYFGKKTTWVVISSTQRRVSGVLALSPTRQSTWSTHKFYWVMNSQLDIELTTNYIEFTTQYIQLSTQYIELAGILIFWSVLCIPWCETYPMVARRRGRWASINPTWVNVWRNSTCRRGGRAMSLHGDVSWGLPLGVCT